MGRIAAWNIYIIVAKTVVQRDAATTPDLNVCFFFWNLLLTRSSINHKPMIIREPLGAAVVAVGRGSLELLEVPVRFARRSSQEDALGEEQE